MSNDDVNSGRLNETALLRRELDRQNIQRLQRMEERMENWEAQNAQQLRNLEQQMSHEGQTQRHLLDQLSQQVQRLSEQQAEQAPILAALTKIVQSGSALRWLIMAGMGLLASLAAVATAWEAIQKWLK